tara:strand:- start:59 stop:415 length:357 start_codon:yes stop_codon:yes gene_type:complete
VYSRFAVFVVIVLLGACAAQNRPVQLISGGGPVYPLVAKDRGVEGYVTVVYDVAVDGSVVNLAVLVSEPAGIFDQAALTAVGSWRFNPRIIDGRAVAARRHQSTVTFKLGDAKAYDEY